MPEFFQRIFVKEKIFFLLILLGISFVLIFDIPANKSFSSSYRFLIFLLLTLNFLVFASSTSENVPDNGKGVSYLMFVRILISIFLLVIYLKGAFDFKGDSLATGALYFTMLVLVISLLLDFVGALKLMKHNRVGKVIAITISVIMFYSLLVNYLTLIPKASQKDLTKKLISKQPAIKGIHSAEYKSRMNKFVNVVKGLDKRVEKINPPKNGSGDKNSISFSKIKETLTPIVYTPNTRPLFQRTIETRKIGMISISAPEATPVDITYGLLGDSPDLNKIKTVFPLGNLIPN